MYILYPDRVVGAEGYTEHKTRLGDLLALWVDVKTPVTGDVIPQQHYAYSIVIVRVATTLLSISMLLLLVLLLQYVPGVCMHKNTYNYPIFFIHLIIRTCLTLSEPPTIFCRFYDLCSYLLSLRACFSCHTFFPGTIEEKSREKKKVDFVFSAVSAGSLSFFCTGSSKLVGLATRTTHSSPMPGATSSSMSSIYRSSPAKRSKLGGGLEHLNHCLLSSRLLDLFYLLGTGCGVAPLPNDSESQSHLIYS